VRNLRRVFDVSKPWLNRVLEGGERQFLTAVADVSFNIASGETFALVGESGSGKSTVARMVVGLLPATAGEVHIDGVSMTNPAASAERQRLRRRIQMIFQDPYASLNPRWRVDRIDADFIVCDEPTSALDVSVQAQILNLMRDLQDRFGLTFLFISHNLAVVRHMASRIGVMYLGRIVEVSGGHELFAAPKHPYTRMLLDAVPDVAMTGKERIPVKGEIPNPITPPSGCPFNPRCPFANERCRAEVPPLLEGVACHAVHEGRIEKGLVAA
jgi:peptide/nickel transport system ATP-binding protein